MKAATSILDPTVTRLFQSRFSFSCLVVLSIINDSLCSGVVPTACKTPVPKEANTDSDQLNLTANNLSEPLQSDNTHTHTSTYVINVS